MLTKASSLYVHVPFCKSICYYCDFCHRIYRKEDVQSWLQALKIELNSKELSTLKTIYIGGGTPTCLEVDELDALLHLFDSFINTVEEYTIEVNPETLSEEKIQCLKKHGVNRISMGLQTADPQLLKTLGRNHTFLQVEECMKAFHTYGITNISLDVMYSLPNQTMQIWKDTVASVVLYIHIISLI